MTRREWKAAARAQLGGGIFKDQWLLGMVFCMIVSAAISAAISILPGIGVLWVAAYMAATEAQYYEYLTSGSGRTALPEF